MCIGSILVRPVFVFVVVCVLFRFLYFSKVVFVVVVLYVASRFVFLLYPVFVRVSVFFVCWCVVASVFVLVFVYQCALLCLFI